VVKRSVSFFEMITIPSFRSSEVQEELIVWMSGTAQHLFRLFPMHFTAFPRFTVFYVFLSLSSYLLFNPSNVLQIHQPKCFLCFSFLLLNAPRSTTVFRSSLSFFALWDANPKVLCFFFQIHSSSTLSCSLA